jgi:predicted Zn-dependent peptidase
MILCVYMLFRQVLKDDLEFGMGMLADMLQNSLLKVDAIENERPVILREAEEVAKQEEEVCVVDWGTDLSCALTLNGA